MKKLCIAAAALLLTAALILSAGCISLGTVSTDIRMGDEKIGTISLTPVQNAVSGSSLTDRFKVSVELFGLRYTKTGLSEAESSALIEDLTRRGLTLSGIQDILAGFVRETDTKASETPSPKTFLDSLLHMPVSADNPAETAKTLDISGAGDALNEAVVNLETLLKTIQ